MMLASIMPWRENVIAKKPRIISSLKIWRNRAKCLILHRKSESSAVGSALRSGRRGRAFESPLSDKRSGSFAASFCIEP